jgi:hypothetical protein
MISIRLLPVAFCLAGAIHGADSKKPVFQVPNSKEEAPRPEDRQGTLKPGDPAPDFNLNVMHSKQSVRLAAFKGKRPVALIFGSYT